MNNTVLIDVMRDTAKVRAELREARQAFDTLVRHIEVLHYNFVQNRGGKLSPPARPPDRPCDERLQRVVGLISELLVVVRGAPRISVADLEAENKRLTMQAADDSRCMDELDYRLQESQRQLAAQAAEVVELKKSHSELYQSKVHALMERDDRERVLRERWAESRQRADTAEAELAAFKDHAERQSCKAIARIMALEDKLTAALHPAPPESETKP